MIERSENRWQFYQARSHQWQWRKFEVNKIVAVSSDGHYSRQACIDDAKKRGYVEPGVFPKKSIAPMPSGQRGQLEE